ncbi:helix-turn-helix domain-containing protein [Thalassospira lohafexi]|uniref:HTH cro/C1-type domain-containing protein n=1 Tax=Thalassospira lohafexi TaxID=744227 RepID=A0A2N3L3T7_9PROT|nr:helix-turn-helix transcriptional regulator [Thalassospira lohafexi]PKR57475.1 hypothetical protein COO92_16165 [Thalassospira lohafexi]
MNIETVLIRIRSYRRLNGLNASQLAARAGIADTTLRDMMNGKWNPTVKTLRLIEAVIPPEFMMNANDDDAPSDPACSGAVAAKADRGDDQHKAA